MQFEVAVIGQQACLIITHFRIKKPLGFFFSAMHCLGGEQLATC